jgi:protein tyrosine phosphatase
MGILMISNRPLSSFSKEEPKVPKEDKKPPLSYENIVKVAKKDFKSRREIEEKLRQKFIESEEKLRQKLIESGALRGKESKVSMLSQNVYCNYNGNAKDMPNVVFKAEKEDGFKSLSVYEIQQLGGCPGFSDDYFDTYNAHRLRKSNLIPVAGPKTQEHLAYFFDNMVFHPRITIKKIVALGSRLTPFSRNWSSSRGFLAYFLEKPKKDAQFTVKTTVTRKIKAKKYSYSHDPDKQQPDEKYFEKTFDEKQILIKQDIDVIRSHLLIKKEDSEDSKKLEIIFIKQEDEHPLRLLNDNIRKALWDTFINSLEEPIVIHCAAGLGRTGQLILTVEILRHSEEIFHAENEEKAAEKIHEIVNRIRENRWLMISTDKQFTQAIENAYDLYQYGIKLGFDFHKVGSDSDWKPVVPEPDPPVPMLPVAPDDKRQNLSLLKIMDRLGIDAESLLDAKISEAKEQASSLSFPKKNEILEKVDSLSPQQEEPNQEAEPGAELPSQEAEPGAEFPSQEVEADWDNIPDLR